MLFIGCAPTDPDDTRRLKKPTSTEPTTTPPRGGTIYRPTGGTGTGFDCDDLPEAPYSWDFLSITPEEDFDFDANGQILYQEGPNLVGLDLQGNFEVVSANVSIDPSGVQVMSTGEIIVGDQDGGQLELVNPANGNHIAIVSGLTQPNGIEIGSDDRIYYSEFTTTGRVRWYDPATDEQGIVIEDTYMPNGVVLSPDEQILYVGGHLDGGATAAILAVDRLGPDSWDPEPRILYETTNGNDYDAVEVDVCGNVYTVEYDGGRVLRIPPEGGVAEPIAQLSDPEPFWLEYNTARWGNGHGGWEEDVLYVTNRNHVFPVYVGVPGKPHPTAVP